MHLIMPYILLPLLNELPFIQAWDRTEQTEHRGCSVSARGTGCSARFGLGVFLIARSRSRFSRAEASYAQSRFGRTETQQTNVRFGLFCSGLWSHMAMICPDCLPHCRVWFKVAITR